MAYTRFQRQHTTQNLGRVRADERALEQKAHDDALMIVRGKINDLLTPSNSHDFIDALDATGNKWTVINNAKYHPIALLVYRIEKAQAHSGISQFKLQKAAQEAEVAGWAVTWNHWHTRIVRVEWTGN